MTQMVSVKLSQFCLFCSFYNGFLLSVFQNVSFQIMFHPLPLCAYLLCRVPCSDNCFVIICEFPA